MNKRITKRDRFNEILAVPAIAENPDLAAFVAREIDLLSKKGGATKPTKEQIANEAIKDILAIALTDEERTITEIQKSTPELATYSNQKISALMSKLCEENRAIRTMKGRKSYFTAV